MEITYFALGMLSMVALMFIGVIVWGLFRVSKIERQFVDIKENVKFETNVTQRQFENVYRVIDDIKESCMRDFQSFHSEITNKFDKMEQFEIKRFDELLRIINDRYDDSIRYTDKRIDKTLNQKEVL